MFFPRRLWPDVHFRDCRRVSVLYLRACIIEVSIGLGGIYRVNATVTEPKDLSYAFDSVYIMVHEPGTDDDFFIQGVHANERKVTNRVVETISDKEQSETLQGPFVYIAMSW